MNPEQRKPAGASGGLSTGQLGGCERGEDSQTERRPQPETTAPCRLVEETGVRPRVWLTHRRFWRMIKRNGYITMGGRVPEIIVASGGKVVRFRHRGPALSIEYKFGDTRLALLVDGQIVKDLGPSAWADPNERARHIQREVQRLHGLFLPILGVRG